MSGTEEASAGVEIVINTVANIRLNNHTPIVSGVSPVCAPVFLHPDFGVRDAPDFACFVESHNPHEVMLKSIVYDRKGVTRTLDGVQRKRRLKSCQHF